MVRLGELMMILDLHRQGLSPAAIARQLGIDRKTVRKYMSPRLQVPEKSCSHPPARAALQFVDRQPWLGRKVGLVTPLSGDLQPASRLP